MKQSVASTEYDQSEKKWQSTNSDGMDIGNVGGSNVQSIAHIALGLTTLGSRVLIQDPEAAQSENVSTTRKQTCWSMTTF